MNITVEEFEQALNTLQKARESGQKLICKRWPEVFGFSGEVQAALIYVEGSMTPVLLQSVERVAIEHSFKESAEAGTA